MVVKDTIRHGGINMWWIPGKTFIGMLLGGNYPVQ